jgi:hypothetical protein
MTDRLQKIAFAMFAILVPSAVDLRADNIDGNAFVSAYGLGDSGNTTFAYYQYQYGIYNKGDVGPAQLDVASNQSGDGYGYPGTYWQSHVTGSIGQFGLGLLHATATADSNAIGTYTPYAEGIGGAAWRDVVYVGSGNNHPDSIQINYQYDGTLSASTFPGIYTEIGFAGAQVYVVADGEVDSNSYLETKSVQGGGNPDSNFAYGGVSHVSFGPGYGSIVSHYDATLGGYGFTVGLFASALAGGGTASANYGDTLSLTSVTNSDGTALSLPYSFDSGLQLQSTVPEPSSFSLLGIAGICLALCVSRRCQRIAVVSSLESDMGK